MITERYGLDFTRRNLADEWKPFPPASDRKAWGKLLRHPVNLQRKKEIIKRADAIIGKPWPPLPATLYLEFARTGNRVVYENPCFGRRLNLSLLVLAECMEYKGRYMDEIANGLLAICEESTWVIPAHAHRDGQDPLPPYGSHNIDLFNSESALVVAEVAYALKKELLALSPALYDRIRHELMRRIIVPFETYDDFWWTKGENNWGSWCALNVLGTALCVVDDKERLAKIIDRLNAVNDRFISFYKDDGACPEGPMYWAVSAGTLAMYLEMLFSCTKGKINLFNEPLIRKMMLFISYSHIDGPWYVNFGDSDAKLGCSKRQVIYRAGEMMDSKELKDFAIASYFEEKNGRIRKNVSLTDMSCCAYFSYYVRELFWIPAPEIRSKQTARRKTVWLPDLQMLVARETEKAGKGLVLTVIGGDNAQGHSHNDIGNFTVYSDSEPVIIDAGIETYCRQTFSPKRYELWFTRGNAHNIPVVNGIEQEHGGEYRAENVKFEENKDTAGLQMDLERAYPAKAGIATLHRSVSMIRKEKCICVTDKPSMKKDGAKIEINFLSLPEPRLAGKGVMEFKGRSGKITLEYDPSIFNVKIKPLSHKDERITASWGKRFYRIIFSSRKLLKDCEYRFKFMK